MKEETENLKTVEQSMKDFNLFIKQCYLIVWSIEKNTISETPKVVETKKERTMLLWKCAMFDGKKSKFIKE